MKKLIFAVIMLSFCSVATADLPESCKVYFDKVENIYKNVPKDTLSQEVLDVIKQNLENAKQEIIALPEDKQKAACAQGLELLKEIDK